MVSPPGTYDNYAQALAYIAGTKLKQPKYEITKPHILIDKGSQDWYYFLDKNKGLDRYNFHYIDSQSDALRVISEVRGREVGS